MPDSRDGERVEIKHIPTPNILIGEDNPDDVFFLERAFARSGAMARLYFVNDGQQVIDFLKSNDPFQDRSRYPFPDLLLLDLKMPRVSGLHVLGWLQAQPDLKKPPVVVLTGTAAPEEIKTAYALGADSCLMKPGDANLVPFVQNLQRDWLHHLLPASPVP